MQRALLWWWLAFIPLHRWITWDAKGWSTLSQMAELILNPRHWAHRPWALGLGAAVTMATVWGAGGLIYLLSLFFNFYSHAPLWGFPNAPPNKHFENQNLNHVGSCLGWGFLVDTFFCIISQSLSEAPITQLLNAEPVHCCFLCLLATNQNSCWHTDFCCHSGFLPWLATSRFFSSESMLNTQWIFLFLTPPEHGISCSWCCLGSLWLTRTFQPLGWNSQIPMVWLHWSFS